MSIEKRKPGRPRVEPKERVQCYLSLDSVKKLDQMAEYLGGGASRSDYVGRVVREHIDTMESVLKTVKAGLLIPLYVKEKDKMIFIKKEDYERGLSLGRQVADV